MAIEIVSFPMKNGESFHSYVSLLEGKPPFSYGFPMVFLWFFVCLPGRVSIPRNGCGSRQVFGGQCGWRLSQSAGRDGEGATEGRLGPWWVEDGHQTWHRFTNHRKTMGKPWENHGKTEVLMGKPKENHRKMELYPLVNVHKTKEHHHF